VLFKTHLTQILVIECKCLNTKLEAINACEVGSSSKRGTEGAFGLISSILFINLENKDEYT
jgi:hypothetical protein